MGSVAPARLTFCGAARGVTGSCYHLAVGDDALVIDCGTFQGEQEERNAAPFPFEAAGVAGVVLTHGHLDHVGRTPLLARAGFRGVIVGHAATLEIAKIIMEDSAKIAQHGRGEPLYDLDDVAQALATTRALERYGDATTIGPFRVQIFDAGHILGSTSVRVSWREGGDERAILFSGDLGVVGAPLIRDPNRTWREDDAVDFVVTESTYGDRVHPDRAESRRVFRETVMRALDNGGKVLIPAFAIGRTQEVLYELNTLVEAGDLRGVPVVIDGPLGLNATTIYERHTGCYDDEAMKRLRRGDEPLEFDHLHEARDAKRSQAAVAIEGPAIIIAGSGMCSGGRIRHHLAAHLPDPSCDVLLVGYQAAGTLGRHLQNGGDTAFLYGEEVPVRAKITTISGFSAHADRDGLLDWLDAVPRRAGGGVFVTHGEEASAVAYSELVAARLKTRTLVPDFAETVALELRPGRDER